MKIFTKTREGEVRKVYFCGMKIFSYSREKKTLISRIDNIEKAILLSFPESTGFLQTIHNEMYELLSFLKKICKKHNLSFWIQGGTLLGAVRHQGFIPWDDDVDCGMIRQDLDKLRMILENDDNYEIIDCYLLKRNIKSLCKMPKIVKKNSHHIFIDIFPYDYVNCNKTNIGIWDEFSSNKKNLSKELLALGFESNDAPIEDNLKLSKVEEIINKYLPEQIDFKNATHIIWGIENLFSRFKRFYKKSDIFPLQYLPFKTDLFPAPKDYEMYLHRQYGDIWKIPQDLGGLRHLIYYINTSRKIDTLAPQKTIAYTAGAFDLFHIGHLNLLRRAKEHCDYLIVGVTSDELIFSTKNKYPTVSLEERIDILKSIKYVDEVVVQDDLDKVKAWKKYKYNKLFSGDDWKDNSRWVGYEEALKEKNVEVIYFPYTKKISSSMIQNLKKS